MEHKWVRSIEDEGGTVRCIACGETWPSTRWELEGECHPSPETVTVDLRGARLADPAPAPLPTPLRCPYCGAELDFELTYTTTGYYSEHRDLTGIECENFRCNARWTPRGGVERLPKSQVAP